MNEPLTISNNSVLITSMVLTALLPTLTAFIAYLKSRAEIEKIHVAVNSERTATLAEIKALRDEILRISKTNAAITGDENPTAQTPLAAQKWMNDPNVITRREP